MTAEESFSTLSFHTYAEKGMAIGKESTVTIGTVPARYIKLELEIICQTAYPMLFFLSLVPANQHKIIPAFAFLRVIAT